MVRQSRIDERFLPVERFRRTATGKAVDIEMVHRVESQDAEEWGDYSSQTGLSHRDWSLWRTQSEYVPLIATSVRFHARTYAKYDLRDYLFDQMVKWHTTKLPLGRKGDQAFYR